MQWYEILLIVAAAAFVVGIAVWQIVRRVKGKGGCDCGCANCPGCSSCHTRKDGGKEKK